MTGLILGILLQAAAPKLETSVDHDNVTVGEEVTYVLRATSRSSEPLKLSLAPINGFEIIARSERTEVSFSGGPLRTTVLEIRLRALRPGRWEIGPARAVQGETMAEAAALTIDVSPSPATVARGLNPRLQVLLEKAPLPPRGKPSVALVVSADTVTVGSQVDVVTAAWFPRDLRLQLRRPPTLQPPVIDGVWSYPQSAPAGIAASRTVAGTAYDLFVAHQVVFPLLPGAVAIPSATLKYSTPLALQFFSQEERFALSSSPETLSVRPLPAAGRPAGFGGAIGAGLQLERRISPPTVQEGEGVAVELRLSGEGNTALWPPPEIAWPRSVRAYVDRVEEEVDPAAGRLGGTKTFRYLVVPDSAGPLTIPAVNYAYFDLASRSYRSANLPAASLPVTPSGEPAATAALPPPLLSGSGPAWPTQLARAVPGWIWLLIFLFPPLAALFRNWHPSLPRVRPAPLPEGLRGAEAKLDRMVRGLVPDPDLRSRTRLAAAVRAAGADSETASRVAVVRERLLARRYGPPDLPGDDADLTAEVDELVQRLGGSLRGWRGNGIGLMLALGLIAGPPLAAQAPPPEMLYKTGALRAAAAGFGERVLQDPTVAAHWYNLGAAHFRLGAEGKAMAAWVRARRLDPREATILRALRLTPPPDRTTARWTWAPPVTPEELLLLGSLGWLVGWTGWMLRPRVRDRWMVLLVFAAVFAVAGSGLRFWYQRPIALVLEQTSLRLSPHGRAPAIAPLETGTAVRLLRYHQGWALVRLGASTRGWISSRALAPLQG